MLSCVLIFIGATCAILVSSAPVTDNVPLEKRASHKGDGTYFYPGLGSSGHYNTDADMIVALSHVQMKNDRNPNNNKNCGKHITVRDPEGSVRVKVADTCPNPYCSSGSIDLSPAAFKRSPNLNQGLALTSWNWY